MVSGKYPKYYKRKSWYNISLFKTLRAWKTCGVFFVWFCKVQRVSEEVLHV